MLGEKVQKTVHLSFAKTKIWQKQIFYLKYIMTKCKEKIKTTVTYLQN